MPLLGHLNSHGQVVGGFAIPGLASILSDPSTGTSTVVQGLNSVPKGSELGLLFGSANHDPSVFHLPDQLDITRQENPHLSFGAGIHFCLGAPLARLELETSFSTVLRRFPRMELVAEPRWKPAYIIRGLGELRVRV